MAGAPVVKRTQVGIVGGGPAGLMLSHLLHLAGIDSVVFERRSREYVQQRVRAGVLEQGTVDLLAAAGLGERVRREGLVHAGVELRFEGEGHRIPLADLTGGRTITIYGQQEVVKDLVDARIAAGAALFFDVPDVTIHDPLSTAPRITATIDNEFREYQCDFLAGCDGFHGISREAIAPGRLQVFAEDHPYGWVGILVQVAPSSDELIYAWHERGFALHSMRSPGVTRLYVQCDPDDGIDAWPDLRVWDELHHRLAMPGWSLAEGAVLEKGITGMRSVVVEPMQAGRMFLAGDAAHIVPPTGAKGLNLALEDVAALAERIAAWYRTGKDTGLADYSAARLRDVWQAQAFSSWMTSLLHRLPNDPDGFGGRLQLARLRMLTRSRAAATVLAENYVGMRSGLSSWP